MNITLIEPFFTGSHAAWAKSYAQYSRHEIEILSLSGNHWKWRMHGGAVTLAKKYLASSKNPDLILATDMLDLTTFLALTRRQTSGIPAAVYFHENQICYPWSTADEDTLNKQDQHYGFINYSSALAADSVFFNSQYHYNSLFNELPRFLKQFPDYNGLETAAAIRDKSRVLPLGMDLKMFDIPELQKQDEEDCNQPPLILWNHRWEYDKNPDEFFKALFLLNDQGLDFRVAILGESFGNKFPIFETAHNKLGSKVVHYGYAEEFKQYAQWLHRADIIPVTSIHDFFGASIVEAIYCGCYPVLPKRLTYPELVPYEDHPELFYSDFNELVEKLAKALQNIKAIRHQNFRHYVEKYSWQNMGPKYDKALSALL
jgi:glycosyltransferase involved in cell wall biosynthesis